MANNRLFLICKTCKPENGSREILMPHAKEWSIMLAKYYPSTGWYPWGNTDGSPDKLEAFLTAHSHGTQWGANIASELEIAEDEKPVTSLSSQFGNSS